MTDPVTHRIPASIAGDCRKALYFHATGVAPSERQNPQEHNRRAAGLALKPVVRAALETEGWQTRLAPQPLKVPVTDTLSVRVAPDLLLSHEQITGGHWITAVTMSAREQSVHNWLMETTGKAYPHRLRRLALAVEAIAANSERPADIDTDQPQLVVMLDRDTGALEYEPNETDYLQRITTQVKERLTELDAALQSRQMPPAEYRRDSRACRRCPYLTLCHGPEPAAAAEGAGHPEPVTDELLAEAVETFAVAEQQLQPMKEVSKRRDEAKEVIKRYMAETGQSKMPLHAEDSSWQASIRTSKRTSLSVTEARTTLTTEQLAAISTTNETAALYITPVG